MPLIDILWVDDPMHRRLKADSAPMAGLPSMRVISLRDLLAMKLHALKQGDAGREKDLWDIITLMKHNPNAPGRDEFAQLCERFGPPGFHAEIQDKWNL
ncbi:MAG: nucleotidyl transferase AbiEii/AbiGii toxin family protein [Akkermansiaceae bacterium]|nr:nucleotidyl transferase AbiEii/AbiGii toxin family protein [Akkermansiaceae bacterium]NNM29534.1 nucleotidyl transferase AbiEii/AbiGii toxin family protein [Akkermansiaceae bacterium]